MAVFTTVHSLVVELSSKKHEFSVPTFPVYERICALDYFCSSINTHSVKMKPMPN